MAKLEPQRIQYSGAAPRAIMATLTLLALMIVVPAAESQTYRVLHNFTDGSDGGYPESTLAIDQAGNLYGTALVGGRSNVGTVFKLTRYGSNYIFNPIYNFQGSYDGSAPWGPVTFGPDGTLYGTTIGGGYMSGEYCEGGGCGVVFRLRPPATTPPSPFTPWSESVLHAFLGPPNDGNQPIYANVTFDAAGNIYGTTQYGGTGEGGIVFKLTPSNGGWTESVLYSFSYGDDGAEPQSGVIMDQAGNLYGTTIAGGSGLNGVVYELSPTQYGWQQTVLHAFRQRDGSLAYAGLVMDQAGNLYGAASVGGTGAGGVVYELSPANGGWTYQVLYNFTGAQGPLATLTPDASGNLYGTAYADGANELGMVFKLTQSNGVWNLTDLHDFDSHTAYFPHGGVTLDASGNLYGTTQNGGVYGWGVVWEITP